jgi:DNA polymerase-3 subunit gamma/tau
VSEQSLYRRHRPQSFDQVVGQEHVVRTLRNALERDRIHHAYLFVGSRGTGKTSMAKILARSLNCVEGPTLEPCGECESCRSIAAGTSLDVIEMDAASNRSVDDIRDLRERVSYAPAAGGWKVYILDEAHMLTREAWNAFLKTLEEPPPNTVFVLATTEPQKVMATIVDRCQRFDFSRPTPGNIAEVVSRVAAAEEISIDSAAVGAVARAANGSFRDALGTLDQLVAYSGTEIATEDVLEVLGLADSDLLFSAADAIAAGDGKAVLGLVADLAGSGRDPSRFATDLVAHLRQLLVIGTIGEVPDHFFVAEEEAERLSAQARRLDEITLLRTIDELSAAIAAVREGDDPRMTVELALLRSARPELDPSSAALAQRLERVERPLRGEAAAAGPAPARPDSADQGDREGDRAPAAEMSRAGSDAVDDGPSATNPVEAIAQGAVATAEQVRTRVEEVRTEVETRVEATAQAAGEAIDLERLAGLWPAIVDQVRHSGSEFLSAAFQAARPVAVDSERSTVEIGFPPSAAFNKRKAEAKENRERFSEALRTVVGERLSPSYVMLDEEPDSEPAGADPVAERIDERELVDRIKAEFDAEELIEHPPDDDKPEDAEEGES